MCGCMGGLHREFRGVGASDAETATQNPSPPNLHMIPTNFALFSLTPMNFSRKSKNPGRLQFTVAPVPEVSVLA